MFKVDAAGLQFGQARLVLNDGPVDDPVNLGGAAPIIGVLLQYNLYARRPAHEFERTGADRIDGKVAAIFLNRIRTDHGRRVHGKMVEERRKDFLQCNLTV